MLRRHGIQDVANGRPGAELELQTDLFPQIYLRKDDTENISVRVGTKSHTRP